MLAADRKWKEEALSEARLSEHMMQKHLTRYLWILKILSVGIVAGRSRLYCNAESTVESGHSLSLRYQTSIKSEEAPNDPGI